VVGGSCACAKLAMVTMRVMFLDGWGSSSRWGLWMALQKQRWGCDGSWMELKAEVVVEGRNVAIKLVQREEGGAAPEQLASTCSVSATRHAIRCLRAPADVNLEASCEGQRPGSGLWSSLAKSQSAAWGRRCGQSVHASEGGGKLRPGGSCRCCWVGATLRTSAWMR